VKLNLVRGEGSGAPVFFQHGLCGSAAQTSEVFPLDRRFQLNTLECRGHGGSESGPYADLSIATFAKDVAGYIQKPSVVGGISMGAAIALHLAVHRPELVKALILARPAWCVEHAPANMRPNDMVGKVLTIHPPDIARNMFLETQLAQHLSHVAPDNLASLLSFFAREPVTTTAALLQSISNDGPGVTEAQVRAITVPTLIIATEQDYIHPVTHAKTLHHMIPQSKLKLITPKGVDKLRYIDEFQSTLLTFLEDTL
jgi:pimeloyl-ACP methyl ester carboxylesterase